MKGIHTCPMVYTGSASNLMVLEVHGKNAEKALVLGRDWRAQCIVQLGDDREQHFFTWPQVITLPDKAALETLDIQVFGEGGKVTLPPSLATDCRGSDPLVGATLGKSTLAADATINEFLKRHFSVAESVMPPGWKRISLPGKRFSLTLPRIAA